MKTRMKILIKILFVFLLTTTTFISNAAVLVFEETADDQYYIPALTALGKTVTEATSPTDFDSKINNGTLWELVIFSDYNNTLNSSTVTALQTWANSGGKIIFNHWDVDAYSTNALFTSTMGFQWVSTFDVPYALTPNSTSHAIFTLPNIVNSFTPTLDQYNSDGQIVTITNGSALATFNSTSNPAIVLSSTGKIIFNAFQPCNFDANLDADIKTDMQELLENQITFLLTPQVPGVPVANFGSITNAIVGVPVIFYDQSTGVPTSWSWTFSGGTPSTSTAQNPTVTYATTGTYAVSLTATNTYGTDTETKTGYITVSNQYNMNQISGTLTSCGLSIYDSGGSTGVYQDDEYYSVLLSPSAVGSKVRLTFNSFSTESGYDYLYVYDGNSASATLLGSYSGSTIPAVITATNTSGQLFLVFESDGSNTGAGFSITTSCYSPTPTIPIANFSASATSINVGTTVNFADLTTGIPTGWSWSFPGGTPSTSTAQNPSVVYSSAGTYEVVLTATNGLGTDVETKTGYIVVTSTLNMTSGTSSVTSCGITIYDNGGTSGNYTANFSSTLTVNPSTAGSKVRLTFNTFYTESNYDYVRVYDGTTTSATLLGSYSGSTIPAVLTATNASGALTIMFTSDGSNSYSGFSITTSCYSTTPTIPVAAFTASATSVATNGSVTFTDNTAGIPTGWSWSFPGGTPSTSTAQNPVVTYSAAGTYSVTLTASNGLGSDVETKTSYITVTDQYNLTLTGTNSITSCSASIFDNGGATGSYSSGSNSTLTINPATAGSKVRLTFNSFSIESTYDNLYVYDGTSTAATLLGTYTGSTIPSPLTASNASGAITIRFTSDGSGIAAGFSITTSCVTPTIPVANFSASTTTPYTGQSVTFTDLSTGLPTGWSWSFTGGTPSTSTAQNPVVTYSTAGTYAVTLTASNGLGSDGETKTGYITVSNNYSMVTGTSSLTTCGMNIFDNGGASNYTSSFSSTLTINPATAGQAVRLTFNSFATETTNDVLSVYNGTSTSATLLGSYSGTTIPAAITATNASGALTIRFTTDGSVVNSGFSITTSCVALPAHSITAASWGTSVDNDGDLYYQSRILNYSANNTTASSASIYAKIYYKLTSASTYTLAGTGTSFTVAGLSTSTSQAYTLSNLPTGSYDIRIELYSGTATLVDTYDLSDNPTVMSSIEFELASSDLYCQNSLNASGGNWDITAVSVTGTTLNNTTTRPTTITNTSYINVFAATATNTGTLLKGNTYTLNVTTSNSDIISVWIDFNQNGTFETTEWWQVATTSTINTPSSISILIPNTATVGQTRMRIRSRAYGNTNGSSDACSNFGSGCTEDYTITINNATPTVPVANFTVSSTTVNVGAAITFTDATLGTPTSWNWSFPGGTPASSTAQNPVVTYNTVGTYNVTLTASNSLGSDVETKVGYITVTSSYIMTSTGTNSISTCGSTIYDNGGATGDYSNSSNTTLTINPGTIGNAVRLNFNSFRTESSYDYLYIYDGTSTSATLLGTYTGTNVPPTITASNPTGALTIRFTSDGSSYYSGFEINTSCVELTDYSISSASITNIVDTDGDSFYQSANLGYYVQNITANTALVYTKIYARLVGESGMSLIGRSADFAISPTSISTQQILAIDNMQYGLYDFIIEVYDATSGDLVVTYGEDTTVVTNIDDIGFESADVDVYCVTGLNGGTWDLTRVSIVGTTLNNDDTRPEQLYSGSYYTFFPLASGYTATLAKGGTYTIGTITTDNAIISMWIDYNQNGVFETTEHVQISTASNGSNSSASFIVPNTALNGKTVMRIRTATSGSVNSSSDACSMFFSGCTEDYEISIGVSTPQITFNGRTLTSSATSGNQWYDQSGLIIGATGRTYNPTANGEYYVIVTTSQGASDPSNIVAIVALDIDATNVDEVSLYPVPVSSELTISNGNSIEIVEFIISDIKGQIMNKDTFVGSTQIDTNNLPSGTYFVKLFINGKVITKTFVKK